MFVKAETLKNKHPLLFYVYKLLEVFKLCNKIESKS